MHGSVVQLSRNCARLHTVCALTLHFTALVLAPVTLYNCARTLQEDVESCNLSIIELYIILSPSRT